MIVALLASLLKVTSAPTQLPELIFPSVQPTVREENAFLLSWRFTIS